MEPGMDLTAPRRSIDQLLVDATAALEDAAVGTPRLDAEVLLARACGLNRTELYVRGREAVAAPCLAAFHTMLARRLRREPLQYIVGTEEFWSLEFMVTPDVLIPRPETELLVELALSSSPRAAALCDVATGSGCIAVALARELPHAQVWGLDISLAALDVAAANAQRHGVGERLHLAVSNLLAAVGTRRFDVITCNPPYVASGEIASLQPELAWEPRRALDGGDAGLTVIRRVLATVPDHLVDGGWLLMEIGADQAGAVSALARQARYTTWRIQDDYAGLPRVFMARR